MHDYEICRHLAKMSHKVTIYREVQEGGDGQRTGYIPERPMAIVAPIAPKNLEYAGHSWPALVHAR